MKSLIINAFAMQSPSHLNPGLTRYPKDRGRHYKDLSHWIELAKKLEVAKFHAIFFADVLGPYDVYKGPQNTDPVVPAGAQFPINDPLYSVPAMAAATESIGFGITAYKLWEGSWRNESYLPDPADGYADPKAVRRIDHKGKYFDIPGSHRCGPSPQRTPFLLQAGTSSTGKAFAATHAEAIFLHAQTPELVRPSVDSIRSQAAATGRNPADIKIIAGILVIVAESDEAARAKFETLASYGDREGALGLFGGWSGYDLSSYIDDQDFRFVEAPAIRSMVNHWASTVPGSGGKKWDKRAIAEYLVLGGNGAKIIGSATTVADELGRWVEVGDVDGFNFSVAGVEETGGTFRENVYGVEGKKRLPGEHPGARYVWKKDEEAPAYAVE